MARILANPMLREPTRILRPRNLIDGLPLLLRALALALKPSGRLCNRLRTEIKLRTSGCVERSQLWSDQYGVERTTGLRMQDRREFNYRTETAVNGIPKTTSGTGNEVTAGGEFFWLDQPASIPSAGNFPGVPALSRI
jgi:hypothetical protein